MRQRWLRVIVLAALVVAAHAAASDMTITKTDSGIAIQGKDWTWNIQANGLVGEFVWRGETLLGGGHVWYETEAGGGSQRPDTPKGDVTIEPEQGRTVARIKTVVQAGEGKATFDLEQRIVAGALPGYPDGAIMLEYTFKDRGVKLKRSALAISWPIETYQSKLYWLEGVNRYPAEPELKSHTIFSGMVRYMRLLAEGPSVAIVPLDYSSFQFQDNRRFKSDTYSVNIYGGNVVSAAIVPPDCRLDPAKTEPDLETAATEYGAIVLPGRMEWGFKMPAEGVAVPKDSKASFLALPQTVHGIANHADLHAPVKFHVDYRKPGTFAVNLEGHSGYGGANLLICLDGQLVLRRDFPDTTQRFMQGSNGIYRIAVPQGEHTITVDNDGKDWLRVQAYIFGNYGSIPPPSPPKPPDYSGKLERIAQVDVGGEDQAFVASEDDWGPKVEIQGESLRKLLGRTTHNERPHLRIPVRPQKRNLVAIGMYRMAPPHRTNTRNDRGLIRIDNHLATIYDGEWWHVKEIVVENPEKDTVDLEFLCPGHTYIDWVSVWCDGREQVRLPVHPRAWNSPVDGRFMRVAPSRKYFMLEDGTPFFPVGLGGGSALPPIAYHQDVADCEEFTKAIFPYMNARKRRYWPSRCTPKPGVIVEEEMKRIAEELALSRRYGIRWLLKTTDQIPGSYPPNFTPQATDRSHQREWTLYLADLWKSETAIFSWACCNEPMCLGGTDEQQRAWHEFISRTLREKDPNHLVGANTWYYPGNDEGQLWALGHEPTIDWVSMHPYKMTDTALVMHKYTEAFPKPSMVAEFATILDNYDAFNDAIYADGHIMDTEGPWGERFLHGILDGQCGLIPWYIGLNTEILDVCGAVRKIVDRMDWTKFDPKPRIGLACFPYQRIKDDEVKKLLLALSKERGIPFDLVLKEEDQSKYELIVRSPDDLPKADALRDVTANCWCKYLMDYAGRAIVWVKSKAAIEVVVKNLPPGDYVVEWLGVRSGDVVKREVATTRDELRTGIEQPGAYIIVIQPRLSATAAFAGMPLVTQGVPAAVLVGPDDLCLDLVSFMREDSSDAYLWLKGLVEQCRLKTGATLELKTPSEATPLREGANYMLLGEARANALAKALQPPLLGKTPQIMVYRNPADPSKQVVQVLGANMKEIIANAKAVPVTFSP